MLKKLFKKSINQEKEPIFPQPPGLNEKSAESVKPALINDIKSLLVKEHNLKEIVEILQQDLQFMRMLEQRITNNLLEILTNKYGFEPTNKYMEETKKRKNYINQLDAYLQERKQINHAVENELQQFLNDAAFSLSKSLENFNYNIQQRVREAETLYGIDTVSKVLLKDKVKEQS